MNRHAVNRLKQRHLDKILPLDETTRRRHRRDDHEGVARVRIHKPMQKAGLRQRQADVASVGSAMFRIATSGCVGVCIASAKVTAQFVPPG